MERKKYFTEKQLFWMSLTFFTFMMLFHLLHSSPWGDEWVEYNYSQRGIRSGELYQSIIRTFQPPLYNFLMHFWLKLSTSILWFRLFNVFCGFFAGITLYQTVKVLTNPWLAAAALGTLGAVYHWIYCIQECSEYALMIMFLCFALYFYVKAEKNRNLFTELFLILSCIGAMYSQYGAFFIVVPLLLAHFIRKCLTKEKREIITTCILYFLSLLFFAVPLYAFFAKKQLAHNAISENSSVFLTLEDIKNFPLVFGKLLGYFLNISQEQRILTSVMTIIGILFLAAGIFLLFQKKVSWLKKSLLLVLFTTYFLFYWLVVFHIYAMVHADKSYGFYSRYAYFFLPIFSVTLPFILHETFFFLQNERLKTWCRKILLCGMAVILFATYPKVLDNWHKAYDREFSEIWVSQAGFKETTYLIGTAAKHGFGYYISRQNCEIQGAVGFTKDIDLDHLPDSFWLWRTNWGGKIWQKAVDRARTEGYDVTIYADHGYEGQLAYCRKSK